MAAGPVTWVQFAILNGAGNFPGHSGSIEQVFKLQPDTFHLMRLPARQSGCILNVDQGQRAIQLGADLKDASYGETLETWKDTSRRYRSLGQDKGQFVTNPHIEAARCDFTNNNRKISPFKVCQLTGLHMVADDGDAIFSVRQDSVDQHRLYAAAMRQHALQLGKGGYRLHFLVLQHLLSGSLPVIQRCE